jgi:SnoaL-like domain
VSDAADFTRRFGEAWAAPTGERLAALLTADVHLVQPLMRPVHDRESARRAFDELFALVPDMHSDVLRWGPTEDGVLIEHRMTGTLGRRPYSWDVIDRLILEDGLARERIAHFDPFPVMAQLLRSPRRIPAALRLLR